jgi:hypothetical protein
MHQHDLLRKCHDEALAVRRVKDSLRITLGWKAPSVAMPRKLSSIAFIIRSLQRHLERQLALEEDGGYLSVVGEEKPNLQDHATRLREEHDSFRDVLRDILPSFAELTPADETRFKQLCDEVDALLKRLDEHDAQEAELLTEALLTDEGGEG